MMGTERGVSMSPLSILMGEYETWKGIERISRDKKDRQLYSYSVKRKKAIKDAIYQLAKDEMDTTETEEEEEEKEMQKEETDGENSDFM